MKFFKYLFIFITVVFLIGCQQKNNMNQKFSLPEGNMKAGKKVFVDLQCNACHSLPAVKQSPSSSGNSITIALGGETRNIKTYSELVTAVVNPSHRIYQGYSDKHKTQDGSSAMRNYNDIMTITQLVDLVSFLQTQYRLPEFERSQYRAYYPGSE